MIVGPLEERAAMSLRFTSPYLPDECQRRIEGATRPFVLDSRLLPGVVARTRPAGFQLRYRRPFGWSSYAPILDATVEPAAGGTRISTRFRLNRFVLAMTTVWFVGVTVIGGAIMIASVRALLRGDRQMGEASVWVGILFPVVLLGLGVGFVVDGRSTGRRDCDQMIAFIRQQLRAVEERTGAP